MTKQQIETFLTESGEGRLNEKLELKNVAYIYSNTDGNFYPNETSRFEFNTVNGNNLLIYYTGKKDKEGNFVCNPLPEAYISFDVIVGFIMVSPNHPKEPYKTGMAV